MFALAHLADLAVVDHPHAHRAAAQAGRDQRPGDHCDQVLPRPDVQQPRYERDDSQRGDDEEIAHRQRSIQAIVRSAVLFHPLPFLWRTAMAPRETLSGTGSSGWISTSNPADNGSKSKRCRTVPPCALGQQRRDHPSAMKRPYRSTGHPRRMTSSR